MRELEITLQFPEDVYRKAEQIARHQNTTLSLLLGEYVQEIVNRDEADQGSDKSYERSMRQAIALMEKGIDLGIGDEGITWKREDLYDRVPRMLR